MKQECPENDLLQQYLAGELGFGDFNSIDDHVGSCEFCQPYLDRQLELLEQRECRQTEEETPVSDSVELINRLVKRLRHSNDREIVVDGISPTAKENCSIPLRLGDYQIVREIGRGGMGVVYEAQQMALGRRVALKVLPPGLIQSESSIARFQREAAAAASLHHTNIVPVYEAGQDNGTFYYAMQLIDGKGLDVVRDEIRKSRSQGAVSTAAVANVETAEPFPLVPCDPEPTAQAAADDRKSNQRVEPEASAYGSYNSAFRIQHSEFDNHYHFVADVGRQAASALHHAHERGIIHRDVKPSNLILDHAGIAWLADFGLAKNMDDGLTGTADTPGTLRYMSPERFKGQVDPTSDVYSLGASLYELLTLEPAFSGNDQLSMLEQIRNVEPMPPRNLDRRIPIDLQTIVLKAMAKEPIQRYPTALAMTEDLARFLDGQPILARQTGTTERLWRWAKKRKALAASLAVISLLIAGTAIASTVAAFHFRNQERVQAQLVTEKDNALTAAEASKAKAVNAALRADQMAADAKRQAEVANAVTDFFQDKVLVGELGDVNLDAVNEMLRFIDDSKDQPPDVEANVRRRMGQKLFAEGQSHRALIHLQLAAKLYEQEFGIDNRETLNTMQLLARTYESLGDHETAIPLLERTLELQKTHLGIDDADTCKTQGFLGVAWAESGHLSRGVELLEEAVELLSTTAAPFDIATLTLERQLREVYFRSDDRAKIESIDRKKSIFNRFEDRPEFEILREWAVDLAIDPKSQFFNPSKAQVIVQHALQENQGEDSLYITLALARFRDDKLEEAASALNDVSNAGRANNPFFDLVLCLIQYRLGKPAEATIAFHRARLSIKHANADGNENVLALLIEAANNNLWNESRSTAEQATSPTQHHHRIVVTTLDDEIDGMANGTVSLREAVLAIPDGGIVEIDLEGTIGLRYGEIVIDKSMTLTGPSARLLTVHGSRMSRVFAVTAGPKEITIQGITMTGGRTNDRLGWTMGGGIEVCQGAKVSLKKCTVTDNIAHEGGGVRVEGLDSKLILMECTVSGNHATIGGGLSVANRATAVIESSTISENFATQDPKSTLDGGALFVFEATVEIHGSTITQNSGRDRAGGILTERDSRVVIENSIVANNYLENFPREKSVDLATGTPDLVKSNSTITIGSSVLGTVNIQYSDEGNNLIGADPKLGPLSDNGGPMKTHALLAGSPAIDAGITVDRKPALEFDQRGQPFKRVVDGDGIDGPARDIGAFEFQK